MRSLSNVVTVRRASTSLAVGRTRRAAPTWLGHSLLVVAGLLLPILLMEIGFRLFGPFLPGEYSLGIEREYDPVLGWRHRAGFAGGSRTSEFNVRLVINSRGLRDEEIAYSKSTGVFRILALGDSFLAAGHVGLEQTMTKQLQGLLRGTPGLGSAEVVNGGVYGYGTAQEYLFLDTEGYKYSPDLVLLVVFLGNDLIDNLRATDGRFSRPVFQVDDRDQLVQVSRPTRDPSRRAGWDDFLLRNSTVYNVLQSGVIRKLEAAGTTGETGSEPGQDLEIYERRQQAKLRKAWEVTEALVGATAQRSTALGARLLVVGAPSFRQIEPSHFDAELIERGLDPSRYDVELPNRQLRDSAARLGLPYLDLLPVLRRAAAVSEGDLYYPRNTHWAPAGHRVVAMAVYQFLVSQGLLPMMTQPAG